MRCHIGLSLHQGTSPVQCVVSHGPSEKKLEGWERLAGRLGRLRFGKFLGAAGLCSAKPVLKPI